MTKIKIESPIYKSKKIMLGNEEVIFSEKGKAEISKEAWDKYRDFPNIFEEGKTPSVQVPEKKIESNAPAILELQKQVDYYKNLSEERLVQVKEAKESEKIWREKAAELMSGKGQLPQEDSETQLLREKLDGMQFKALQKFLKEAMDFDAEKVHSFSNKQELIEWAIKTAKSE